ncbi:MAG: hypothetical protein ABL907_11190 [Hyphomicrobium sp.]
MMLSRFIAVPLMASLSLAVSIALLPIEAERPLRDVAATHGIHNPA